MLVETSPEVNSVRNFSRGEPGEHSLILCLSPQFRAYYS